MLELIREAEVDLFIAYAEGPAWVNLNKIPCSVAAVRGSSATADISDGQLTHILVPTSAGPNTLHALSLLLPITAKVEVTALYVAPSYLGEHEEALGRSRLKHAMNFIDAGNLIQRKLIQASSITEGIVQEASQDYDMVIIGASRESSVDKVLFGDIPGAVVRQSKKPVAIIREPKGRLSHLWGWLAWRLQNLLPRLSRKDRTDTYVRIRRGRSPQHRFLCDDGFGGHDRFSRSHCQQRRRGHWGHVGGSANVTNGRLRAGGCAGRCPFFEAVV